MRRQRGVRVAIALMGDVNLCFSVLHRTLDGMARFTRELGRLLPDFRLTRSTPLIRSH